MTIDQLLVYLSPVVVSLLIYVKSRFDAKSVSAKAEVAIQLQEKELQVQRKNLELDAQREQTENAKAIRDTMIFGLKRVGQLEEVIEELEARHTSEIAALREQVGVRDRQSEANVKKIKELELSIEGLKAEHRKEVERLLGELKEAYAQRDMQLERANELAAELDALKQRVATLERPHTGDTDKLTPPPELAA